MSHLLTLTRTGFPLMRQQIRKLSSQNLDERFRNALDNVKKLGEDPGNDVKLKLYALYKQATEGPCTTAKPSVFNIVEKAKWEAWSSLGQISNTEAKEKYIASVESLIKQNSGSGDSNAPPEKELLFEKNNGVGWIKFNRPKKFNAITSQMYEDIPKLLQDISNDDSIKFGVITGVGNYYCSGNDLSNFQKMAAIYKDNLRKGAEDMSKVLQKFVGAFIDFPKPLIGAVNGPAIGIAVTTLGLMDCVIASDTATFQSPFTSLGQSPEGCSTYTFPRIMGYSRASEMLYLNYKMNAKEAEACGFVSRIVPSNQFESHLNEWLYGKNGLVNTCYPKSMMFSKGLVRTEELREKLHQVNKNECETIIDRWISDECVEALQKFFTRKSNL